MDSSILDDVKKYLGSFPDYDAFDVDIIMNINAAFFNLFQLGIGCKKKSFFIDDKTPTWRDFVDDETVVSAVKQYVFLKVKNVFDPPTTGYVLSSYDRMIQELEWRIRELGANMFDEDCCCEDELPIATKEDLGCVIIGDNVGVTEEGVISVSASDIFNDKSIPVSDVDGIIDKILGTSSESDQNEDGEIDEEDKEEEKDDDG